MSCAPRRAPFFCVLAHFHSRTLTVRALRRYFAYSSHFELLSPRQLRASHLGRLVRAPTRTRPIPAQPNAGNNKNAVVRKHHPLAQQFRLVNVAGAAPPSPQSSNPLTLSPVCARQTKPNKISPVRRQCAPTLLYPRNIKHIPCHAHQRLGASVAAADAYTKITFISRARFSCSACARGFLNPYGTHPRVDTTTTTTTTPDWNRKIIIILRKQVWPHAIPPFCQRLITRTDARPCDTRGRGMLLIRLDWITTIGGRQHTRLMGGA